MNQFRSYRFFDGMRIPHLGLLIQCASEKTYQAGEILFKEGDPVEKFFLIKSGSLALYPEPVAETRVVKTAKRGDVLGWSCLIPETAWHLSGQALSPTSVTILDRERLLAAAEKNPEFGCELLERAAQMEVECLESEEGFLKIDVEPLPAAAVQTIGETISGNSPFYSSDALDLSPSRAKQLCLQDGQWVQLTDQHGSAILPVRIKFNQSQNKHPSQNGQSSSFPAIDEQLNAAYVPD